MFQKIGIIGAGTMGIGMVVDLSLHGIESVLVDMDERALEKAKKEILQTIRFAPMIKKCVPRLTQEEVLTKVTFKTSIEDVSSCDYIVENVTENWDIKHAVYLELDRVCAPETIFAANTSCISITKIGSITKRPEKVIGMHFMNPVFMKQTIEVIKGFHTSEETIAKAEVFLTQLGKEAIIVNDMPGFVSNRISHLYMNEAVFVVQDQVATPEQVDDIFKKCFGHTMGPLETADLIGLDTVLNSLEVLHYDFQDPKFRVAPLLRKMVDAGLLGRKSGKGFYHYQ
ncbi:3-hydroxybutyryl-CoA dehydrogenase [Brevibacillus antibioticus]|uniref:3-hydroxybutyryl-CoA dehydrogenase n=1 Tax=Brevibacillus antibioticus TaxID=2570228 RepID=A0A4V5TIH1_9BACL|nr:3-hydroxyacyl-CoA dehydrogenase NAD-binding domain-containing protein [Brevibacillus antibioticus]TKI55063.1 3-hydroxybutyryl-CoA dehydrogenase [Brevibacillus antibioticus]